MGDWLKTSGYISVEKEFGRVVLNLCPDFCAYYKWFVERRYRLMLNEATFGPHVTLGNTAIHKKLRFDIASPFHGQRVNIEYLNDIKIGGYSKGFLNFWMHVRSTELDQLRYAIKAFDNKDFQGIHVTIGNNKGFAAQESARLKYREKVAPKRGHEFVKEYPIGEFWPPLIEVRK